MGFQFTAEDLAVRDEEAIPSKIAIEARRLDRLSRRPQVKKEFQEQIQAHLQERAQIISGLQELGLKVQNVKYPNQSDQVDASEAFSEPYLLVEKDPEVARIAFEQNLAVRHDGDKLKVMGFSDFARQSDEFIAALQEVEVTVHKVQKPELQVQHLKDLSQVDDAGKALEVTVRVAAFTAEQIEKVYAFAKEKNMGVMTIGAKTSALGVFEAEQAARLRGLDGVIGLEMPAGWDASLSAIQGMSQDGIPEELLMRNGGKIESAEAPHKLLRLPSTDELGQGEELVLSEKFPLAMIRNPEGKHRVIAHSTVTVSQVNDFLSSNLKHDRLRFQIMPDLTSKDQAALGGVITTGAQGGNRTSARVDMRACLVVDASGTRQLEGQEAQEIVGNNGYTGTVVQAEFEVTPVPKHEFGMVFMIPGETPEERWGNLLALQQRLTPYGIHPSQIQLPSEEEEDHGENEERIPRLHLSGMEILARGPLLEGMHKKSDPSNIDQMQKLRRLVDSERGTAELYVYVTGATLFDISNTDEIGEVIFDDLFVDAIGMDEEEMSDEESFFVLEESKRTLLPYSDVFLIRDDGTLRLLDEIRHQAPETARGEANKLGGVTYSTDFNIQFTAKTKEANTRAHQRVADIFARYEAAFQDGPYRMDLYGHAFNGMAESPLGGGFDPHVRITLELNNPATRYDAPERVLEIESLRKKLYRELLSLDGVDGIVVAPPEKSHLTNSSYYHWLRIFYPERVEALEEAVFGGSSDDQERMLNAFRLPLELPREPRRGMASFLSKALVDHSKDPDDMSAYAEAILKLSQEKHRGPRIKGMFREVMATLREKLYLDPHRQPSFLVGSVSKAMHVLNDDFGADVAQMKIRKIDHAVDFESLDATSFADDEIVLIPTEHLGGLKGACIMVTPLTFVQDSYHKGGVLADMHAKYPYETPETPNIPAMAYLGLSLQREELRFDDLDETDDGQRKTLNPGPTQIASVLLDHIREEGFDDRPFEEDEYHEVTGALRRFLKMPEHMSLAFTPSATDAMVLFAKSLAEKSDEIAVTQVTNGNFANRFHDIMVDAGVEVNRLTTPWTTSENSQMTFLIDDYVRAIKDARKDGKLPVFVMTPHKTSTTAHFHPNIVVNALRQRGGFEPGKDYEMVCDLTSGIGAIDYFDGQEHQALSWFGGVQKALGCPPGLGMVSLSPKCKELFVEGREEYHDRDFSMLGIHRDAEASEVHNPALLRLLGVKCLSELAKERDIGVVAAEVRQRMNIVLGFLALHPELALQVPDPKDQSPVLAGVYSISRNLKQAARLMSDIFGMDIGNGYGPFKDEAIRLYLANVTDDELRAFLLALDRCLEFASVTQTVNPKVPIKTLREPHDPLMVLEDLVLGHKKGLVADDLWRYSLALQWVNRLLFTRKKGEASIYGSEENLDMMQRIMDTKLTQYSPSLYDSYSIVTTLIESCYDILLHGDETKLGTVEKHLGDVFYYLQSIVLTLQKYAKSAPQTEEGRRAWPITATEVQIPRERNGNGKH